MAARGDSVVRLGDTGLFQALGIDTLLARVRPAPSVKAGLPPLGVQHVTIAAGTEVAWSETGSGPPLVLLHGIGDTGRTWRRVAPLLAHRFRVVIPDLPGHGLSGRPDAPYTLGWFADVLDAWMQAIDLPRAHFCGHSYGGGVAQWMVLTHRRRIDRLALVAAGGLGHEVMLGLRLAAIPILEALCTPAAMRIGTRLAMTADSHRFGTPERAEIDELARVNGLPGTGMAFARMVRGVIDVFGQHVQTCREVAAADSIPPIAVFWGDDDPVIPASHGRMALERFQGATLSMFHEGGHFPHLLAAERLAFELAAFLADPTRAPAQILFACPGGPRSTGPNALPVGRCAHCTWRTTHERIRQILP